MRSHGIFLYAIALIPLTVAEVPLSSVSLWSEVDACAQSCAESASSSYSSQLSCPSSDPASCICTLGPLSIVAGKAHVCGSKCSLYVSYSVDAERARALMTEYCQANIVEASTTSTDSASTSTTASQTSTTASQTSTSTSSSAVTSSTTSVTDGSASSGTMTITSQPTLTTSEQTSTPTSSTSAQAGVVSKSTTMSGGAKAGIAIGVIGAVAGCLVGGYFWFQRRNRSTGQHEQIRHRQLEDPYPYEKEPGVELNAVTHPVELDVTRGRAELA